MVFAYCRVKCLNESCSRKTEDGYCKVLYAIEHSKGVMAMDGLFCGYYSD